MRAAALISSIGLYLAVTSAVPLASDASPSVRLDNGTFVGTTDGAADVYLGIKFANAPRFQLPVPVGPYSGVKVLEGFGAACTIQESPSNTSFALDPSTLPPDVDGSGMANAVAEIPAFGQKPPPVKRSEDCLNINVWAPTGTQSTDRLPVVVWIYGGAFLFGETNGYNGSTIVRRSIELEEPVVYVSMNYRISAYGFIGGKQVKAAGVGNIGLEDQRVALRWVQKYIHAFGGDPTRVTIWGESAGAISVSLHMLTNGGNTEGLFHAAFMQSGAPIPVGDITNGQPEYDTLVNNTSCRGEQDSLECLRRIPFDELKSAVDKSPSVYDRQALRLAWLPRADGRFLVDFPQKLIAQGSVANVPYVTGSCDDEGTAFSLSTTFGFLGKNHSIISNDKEFREYMLSNYITGATESDVGDLFDTAYPNEISKGSPFNTGPLSGVRQFKRLSAIQGDLVFQAPRRFFLEKTYNKQRTWAFLSKRLKLTPFLGSFHSSDLTYNTYAPGDLTDYLVHFVNHHDPNGNGQKNKLIPWPQYELENRAMLTLGLSIFGSNTLNITADTYRRDGFNKLTELSREFPL